MGYKNLELFKSLDMERIKKYFKHPNQFLQSFAGFHSIDISNLGLNPKYKLSINLKVNSINLRFH